MRILAPLGVSLVATTLGCASPCARVKKAHAEITERTQPVAAGDHLRLSVPLALVNQVVKRELRGLPRPRLPLPTIAGVSLGTATVGVENLTVVPGAPGEVSFVAAVSVRSGKRVLLPVQLSARVRPRLDPAEGTVVVALDKQGLVTMNAKLGPGGVKGLIDVIWGRLPPAARMLTSKSDLADLAEPVANQLLGNAVALVKRELLDDLGRVARIELDLPPVPVDAIEVRSTPADLVVGVHTPLPARGALPAGAPRKTPAHQVELAIHGAVAVELVNDAMKRGEVPRRFGLDGAPAVGGPLLAHLDWAGAAAKPLRIHAFLLDPAAAGRRDKDCAHVTLAATPKVGAQKGGLVLATGDAQVENVSGSASIKAGLFFSGVSRQSFDHVEHLAVDTEFELGQQALQAQLQSATLEGEHLRLGLTLAPRR